MQNWFECKVRYTKTDEQSGKEKKVMEPYLVDSVSFSEAEARIYEKCGEFIHVDFTVSNISKASYSEIFDMEEGDYWYKCKVNFISIDEASGKEKKISTNMLIMANSVKEAYDNLLQKLGASTFDYEILAISRSAIIDIFPYSEEEERIKGKKLIRTTEFDKTIELTDIKEVEKEASSTEEV